MGGEAHDGQKKGWVLEDNQPLKKKGPGRGIHQSDFICSTVGCLKDASVTLEYGKNHEGFWNCELFIKQLMVLGMYIAVVLVDNLQGHAAYAKDALRVSKMGFHPGGKQCRMRNGWFTHNRQKIDQSMLFPPDHPQYPDQPKGMQQVLIEQGLWKAGLYMKCKGECPTEVPDFQEQKSLVQEVIEEAGEFLSLFVTCICCTKFIQGICVSFSQNFIEYFWHATLHENMPKALASIKIELIRKWEHR
ncbi:hypothetical protein GG344DRAFT_91443 [Lentinula edodes]|nr:hypothetical protein GG344DRAFT_91443 [Lentinula edodes]